MRPYLLLILATTSAACCYPRLFRHIPTGDEAAEIDAKAKAAPEIRLDTIIDEASAKKMIEELDAAAKENPKWITIRLNTPGGNFEEALNVVRRMEAIEVTIPIRCLVDGDALSAGFYVLQACSTRTMTARSRLMAHEPYFPILTNVTIDDLQGYLTKIRATRSAYAAQCSSRLRISRVAFNELIRARDWYLTPSEALEVGAVDALQALRH